MESRHTLKKQWNWQTKFSHLLELISCLALPGFEKCPGKPENQTRVCVGFGCSANEEDDDIGETKKKARTDSKAARVGGEDCAIRRTDKNVFRFCIHFLCPFFGMHFVRGEILFVGSEERNVCVWPRKCSVLELLFVVSRVYCLLKRDRREAFWIKSA